MLVCCSSRSSPTVVVGVFAFVATFAIAKGLDLSMGLRVTPEQELTGLDTTQHSETAYN